MVHNDMQCVCTVQYSTVQCTVGGCVMVRPGPEPPLEPRCHSGRGRESRQSPSDTETSQTQTQTQRIQSTHSSSIHKIYIYLFRDTSLIQIWKKKGSALDLKNMRFIHMRMWQSRLFTSLITEKIKSKVVEATPKSQLVRYPGQSSVDHLVTLKTWMNLMF